MRLATAVAIALVDAARLAREHVREPAVLAEVHAVHAQPVLPQLDHDALSPQRFRLPPCRPRPSVCPSAKIII